jgi:sterol 22-desaturase
MAANATTSPLATIKYGAASVAPQLEYVIDYVSNASTLSILATILATLVVYDQCMFAPGPTRPGLTASANTLLC